MTSPRPQGRPGGNPASTAQAEAKKREFLGVIRTQLSHRNPNDMLGDIVISLDVLNQSICRIFENGENSYISQNLQGLHTEGEFPQDRRHPKSPCPQLILVDTFACKRTERSHAILASTGRKSQHANTSVSI